MITFHLGLPKTGTTSCQGALSLASANLERAGILYPKQFRNKEGIAHHELSAELISQQSSLGPCAELFLELAGGAADKNVLISSEAFTNALAPRRLPGFKAFLLRAASISPIRLVISLRRIDQFIESMYLHSIKTGYLTVSLDDYVAARKRWSHVLFAGLLELRNEAFITEVATVRYQSDPSFRFRLMNALLQNPAIARGLPKPPYAGVRLSLKAQITLLHLSAIFERLGLSMDRTKLIRDFETGRFRFDKDIHSYTVMSYEQARQVHFEALRASIDVGEPSYAEYFGDARVEERQVTSLDMNVIDRDDLAKLRKYMVHRSTVE